MRDTAADPEVGLRQIVRAAGTGERLTPQRRAVWQLFADRHGHLTVDAILSALHPAFPGLNTGTVYRELAWLKRHGLICETDVGSGAKVYERVTEPRHHHMVCLACGSVADLGDGHFDALRESLVRETGFAARMDHFAVFGTCSLCRR